MNDPSGFTKLVPGFDFMQNLVKNAGAAMPGIGQWVAPTIDPEELAKRIEELRTVQFWLEQNARMLGATIQAMEVQRMTLSTLKTMNVQMEDLRDSLKITIPGVTPPASPTASAKATSAADTAGKAAAVDPMQWWGALARQFTDIAAQAMKDPAADASRAAAIEPAGAAPSASAATPAAEASARSPKAPVARKTGAPR